MWDKIITGVVLISTNVVSLIVGKRMGERHVARSVGICEGLKLDQLSTPVLDGWRNQIHAEAAMKERLLSKESEAEKLAKSLDTSKKQYQEEAENQAKKPGFGNVIDSSSIFEAEYIKEKAKLEKAAQEKAKKDAEKVAKKAAKTG